MRKTKLSISKKFFYNKPLLHNEKTPQAFVKHLRRFFFFIPTTKESPNKNNLMRFFVPQNDKFVKNYFFTKTKHKPIFSILLYFKNYKSIKIEI